MTLLVGLIIGIAAVKLYNIIFTPEERKILEDKVKTHHFEYEIPSQRKLIQYGKKQED